MPYSSLGGQIYRAPRRPRTNKAMASQMRMQLSNLSGKTVTGGVGNFSAFTSYSPAVASLRTTVRTPSVPGAAGDVTNRTYAGNNVISMGSGFMKPPGVAGDYGKFVPGVGRVSAPTGPGFLSAVGQGALNAIRPDMSSPTAMLKFAGSMAGGPASMLMGAAQRAITGGITGAAKWTVTPRSQTTTSRQFGMKAYGPSIVSTTRAQTPLAKFANFVSGGRIGDPTLQSVKVTSEVGKGGYDRSTQTFTGQGFAGLGSRTTQNIYNFAGGGQEMTTKQSASLLNMATGGLLGPDRQTTFKTTNAQGQVIERTLKPASFLNKITGGLIGEGKKQLIKASYDKSKDQRPSVTPSMAHLALVKPQTWTGGTGVGGAQVLGKTSGLTGKFTTNIGTVKGGARAMAASNAAKTAAAAARMATVGSGGNSLAVHSGTMIPVHTGFKNVDAVLATGRSADPLRGLGTQGVTIGQGQGWDAYNAAQFTTGIDVTGGSLQLAGIKAAAQAKSQARQQRLQAKGLIPPPKAQSNISESMLKAMKLNAEAQAYAEGSTPRKVKKQDTEVLPWAMGFGAQKLHKTIQGPDFMMSEHSQGAKRGQIRTSEGTFQIENKGQVTPELEAAEKSREQRTEDIRRESKNRVFSSVADRYARMHPRQKLKKKSLIQKIMGGFGSTVSGGISKVGGAATYGAVG